jgi:hypothetical protein
MAIEVASAIARRQFGALARWQLVERGIGDATIRSWLRRGRLHRVYPGVYAWGRRELSMEGELAAGLLYAGKGSALTDISMLWWRGLLGRRPDRIHIATPSRVRPLADLAIRQPAGAIHRTEHRGLPILAFPDALIPAANTLTHNTLRLVIARAEYHDLATLSAIEEAVRPGRRGGRAVRAALAAHLPQLARCENGLERGFLLLCESGSVEIPEPNVRKGRYRPDMTWEAQKFIVELDGGRAHSKPAQLVKDARRQAWLESQGYGVTRFGPDDVFRTGERTLALVRGTLAGV